jgi:hypothetical protein
MTSAASGGTGDTGSGGSVNLTPDGGADSEAGVQRSFSAYCGNGTPCVPGLDNAASLCNAGLPGDGAGGGGALSCRLQPDETGATVAACGLPGPAAEGEACASASDCQAGLGCVATGDGKMASGGLCRAYCCADPEACPGGTYCALEPLADAAWATTALIPVCAPVIQCELLSDEAQCPEGSMCSIVRDDGTTSCIDAGDGEECDPCPCAPGYVCSEAMNQCKKLCHTSGQYEDECGAGYCQGGVGNLPAGIGICASAQGC